MAAMTAFSPGFYFSTVSRLLMSPGAFFEQPDDNAGIGKPMAFLVVSSVLFSLAAMLAGGPDQPLWMAPVLFVNAVGMVWLAAGLGWMVVVLTIDRNIAFDQLFRIYAYSGGLTLLASWAPFFLVLTEPWRWCLIGIGLHRRFRLRWHQIAWVLGLSVIIIILLFWSAFPVVRMLRG